MKSILYQPGIVWAEPAGKAFAFTLGNIRTILDSYTDDPKNTTIRIHRINGYLMIRIASASAPQLARFSAFLVYRNADATWTNVLGAMESEEINTRIGAGMSDDFVAVPLGSANFQGSLNDNGSHYCVWKLPFSAGIPKRFADRLYGATNATMLAAEILLCGNTGIDGADPYVGIHLKIHYTETRDSSRALT